jgi:hypothetical protein
LAHSEHLLRRNRECGDDRTGHQYVIFHNSFLRVTEGIHAVAAHSIEWMNVNAGGLIEFHNYAASVAGQLCRQPSSSL